MIVPQCETKTCKINRLKNKIKVMLQYKEIIQFFNHNFFFNPKVLSLKVVKQIKKKRGKK